MTDHDGRLAELFGPRSVEPAGLRSAARSGTRWSIAAQVGGRVATVATFLVLVRLVSPEAFGVVALAAVVVALAQIVVDGGLAQAVVQRDDLRPGHADTAFWSGVAVSVVLVGVLAVTAGPLGALLGEPDLAPILRVLGLGLVIGALGSVQAALARRRFGFRVLALRTTTGGLVGGVAGVGAAVAGAGAWALVVQFLATGAAGTVLLWAASPWRPGVAVSATKFRELFRFGRHTLGGSLLGAAGQRADDLVVGAWLGSAALGVYAVAYRLLTLLQGLIDQTVATVSLPVLSRLQGDPAALGRMYRAALGVCTAVSLPTGLFFVVAAPDAVAVFFGARWSDAAPVMRVLALAVPAYTVTALGLGCLVAAGRPGVAFRIRLVWVVVFLVSLVVAVPHGTRWVAVVVVTSAWLVVGLPVGALRRAGVTTLRTTAVALAGPVVASGVVVASLVAVAVTCGALSAPARLALLAVVGAAVHLATLRLVDRDLLQRMWAVVRTGRP